ncbi:MAG: DEAD/DEAH box helicase [bacterium]
MEMYVKYEIHVNNVKSQIVQPLPDQVIKALRSKLSAEMVGAFYARQRNPYAGVRYFFSPKLQQFSTGLLHYVREILEKYNLEYEHVDMRPPVTLGTLLQLHDVTLRDYQQQAVDLAVERQRGIIRFGTGGGKTKTIASIIARLNVKTLILIHKTDIFYQLIDTFEKTLKIPIGQIGDGLFEPQRVTVGMIQSVAHIFDPKVKVLAKENKILAEKADAIKQFLNEVEFVVVDECHHIAADTFWTVLQNIPNALYRIGVTATDFREDNMDLMLEGGLAKKFIDVSSSNLIDRGYLVKPDIFLLPVAHQRRKKGDTYGQVYKEEIVENYGRNIIICDLALKAKTAGKTVLISITQIEHGEILESMLQLRDKSAIFVNGQSKSEVRKQILKGLDQANNKIVISTNIFSEGVDIRGLDTLINAAGAASGIHSLQLLGRVLRTFPGKTKAWVIDLQDSGKYLNNHSKERVQIYETEPRYQLVPVSTIADVHFI